MRVLFVCLGNICRSPTAEAVLRHLAEREGVADELEIDSAGTGDWHVGSAPDERASSAARRRGVTLGGRARQVERGDFDRFDLLLAMDSENARNLRRLAPGDGARGRVRLLREFDPLAHGDLDVPDPYSGGPEGFEEVLDIVERSARGLLAELRAGTL